MKSPLQILTDESKWMKYRYHNDEETRFCIQGALNRLELSQGLLARWRKAILQSIHEHFPERVSKWIKQYGSLDIETFNDSTKTTFLQVHKVLKDAELKLEMRS